MAQIRHEVASELVTLAKRLLVLCQELANGDESVHVESPDISGQRVRGECLQCHKVKRENYRRGLCRACYQRTFTKIKGGQASESQLVSNGALAPKSSAGRRAEATELDRILNGVEQVVASGAKKKREKGR